MVKTINIALDDSVFKRKRKTKKTHTEIYMLGIESAENAIAVEKTLSDKKAA